MSSSKSNSQSGFMALISALVICALLVVIAASVSALVFFSRFDLLDGQAKTQSFNLARGCLDEARVRLAQGAGGSLTGSVSIGSDSCAILSVQQDSPQPGQITIQVQAQYARAATNLQMVITASDSSLISWQELPNF